MIDVHRVVTKLAAKERGTVRGHLRSAKGKGTLVRPHTRTRDKKPEKVKETPEEKKIRERGARKAKEIALWQTWNENGRTADDLRPLLKSLQPLIQREANVYKGKVRIPPPSAIDLEFQTQALNALRAYRPDKGTAVGTFVTSYLAKARRFVSQNQNIARIPENRVYKIRQFEDAEADLEEKLGRPAKDKELAGYLGWKVPEVMRMSAEIRKDLRTHSFEEDPSEDVASREREVLRMLRHELNEDEKIVYDLIVRKQVTSTSVIAAETKFPPYKVSRIKKSIAKKAQGYLP